MKKGGGFECFINLSNTRFPNIAFKINLLPYNKKTMSNKLLTCSILALFLWLPFLQAEGNGSAIALEKNNSSLAFRNYALPAQDGAVPDSIPEFQLGPDTTLCEARSLRLSIPEQTPDVSIEWSDGSTDTVLIVSTTGTYWATARNDEFLVSDTIYVRFAVAEWQGLPGDTALCNQESYTLDASLDGASLYLWQDGSKEPTYEVDRPGKYLVKVVVDQCTLQDSLQVDWCEPCIGVPNAFTPNDDGLNDTFGPIIQCPAQQYNLKIFNRWGQLVFETNNPMDAWDGAWDGQPQPSDTYFYTLSFQSSFSEPLLQQQGDMVLLR